MNEENEKKNSVYISKGKGYELFKFLLAAKSTDKNRYILNRIYCDESDNMGVLVATDSKRMHILFNVWSYGFQQGVQYMTSMDSHGISFVPIVNPDRNFPNWKSVMPKFGDQSKEFNIEIGKKTKNLLIANISYILGENHAPKVNGEFLAPLSNLPEAKIRFEKDKDLIEVSGHDVVSLLDYKAIILGMRNF